MTFAVHDRAITFPLVLRQRDFTWSSNFNLESMMMPSNLTYGMVQLPYHCPHANRGGSRIKSDRGLKIFGSHTLQLAGN